MLAPAAALANPLPTDQSSAAQNQTPDGHDADEVRGHDGHDADEVRGPGAPDDHDTDEVRGHDTDEVRGHDGHDTDGHDEVRGPGAPDDHDTDEDGGPGAGPRDAPAAPDHAGDADLDHAVPAETTPEPKAQLYVDLPPSELRGVHMGSTLYTRTGIHVRLHLTASYLYILNSSAANRGEEPDFPVEHASVSAVPVDLELWLGGALRRDLAMGLVLRTGQASGGRLGTDSERVELEGGLTTAFVGVGMVYYLNPARGWLIGASAGFERWQASFVRGAAPEVGGSGIAVSLYGGHEWWLTPSIALGLVPRLNLGFATGDGRAEVGQLQLENSDVDFYLQGGFGVSLSYF